MLCPCRFERYTPTFLKIESMYHFKRYAHAGFRVGHCLYVTLMQVLEFRINTSYYLRFTIHIVLNPSVMAVGAFFFYVIYMLCPCMFETICIGALIAICFTSSDVERLHALFFLNVTPMHVWEPIFLKRYAHACFRDEHCSYVTPMHVCVFASALPTLELCKSLKVNSFGRIQAGCADANLHIYINIYIYIYIVQFSPV